MAKTPKLDLNLPTPAPGGTNGPEWAEQINENFEIIDEALGNPFGVDKLDIDKDLNFNAHNATRLRSTRYENHGSVLNGPDDKSCIFVRNGDLYYNNSAGTAVRITAGANIYVAGLGGIGGDYATSTALLTYSDALKLFTFLQDTGKLAKVAVGDISLYQAGVTGANPVVVKSPNSLAASYNLTLLASLPTSGTEILTINSSGQMNRTVVLTSLDIDGSTASNTSRITLPKNSFTNLLALTRKEGTLLYENRTVAQGGGRVWLDDGTFLRSQTFNPALGMRVCHEAIADELRETVSSSLNVSKRFLSQAGAYGFAWDATGLGGAGANLALNGTVSRTDSNTNIVAGVAYQLFTGSSPTPSMINKRYRVNVRVGTIGVADDQYEIIVGRLGGTFEDEFVNISFEDPLVKVDVSTGVISVFNPATSNWVNSGLTATTNEFLQIEIRIYNGRIYYRLKNNTALDYALAIDSASTFAFSVYSKYVGVGTGSPTCSFYVNYTAIDLDFSGVR